MASPDRAERRLVLVGGGHAHVGVLRSLGMRRQPGLEVVLVAKELDAPYSGMLPGYVAGHYDLDACQIDLARLAHFAGARLIHGEAAGVDRNVRQLHILGRPSLAYNVLSIDTGITPSIDDIVGAGRHAIAVKPVSTFAPRWKALEARALAPDGPRRLVVVGTGAAGFELVLAMRHRLRMLAPQHGISPAAFSFALVGSSVLLPTHNCRARTLAASELASQAIELVTGDAAVEVEPGGIRLASGRRLASDATLVTTKAVPPAWFRDSGLAIDAGGFLLVRDTLQMVGDDDIFAAGDCASVVGHPREKAGVFAVRQGPPLTRNIRLRAEGLPALPFVPQRQFLTLLSCGDKTAIASRGSMAGAGAWAWHLKDWIDRRFMRRFQELPDAADMGDGADAMLCAGCAAKLGPAPLANALGRFAATAPPRTASLDRRPHIENLAPGDDAAILDLGGGALRLESVDSFPAIWPEPYVLGEIAAAHALSDIFAKGGKPDHALALATLPPASAHLQEDDLFQMLAGARSILEPAGATLVGGHTSRGDAAGIGFFVSGTIPRDRVMSKGGLEGGEVLVLTKPLGTGILFAAWMRRRAAAREIAAAIEGMRKSNESAARILLANGASAATDVTGFGLAGHLIEMLEASDMQASIGFAACPRYAGVDRLIAAGIRSSLLPENLALSDRIELACADHEAALALLFDPQTSGGLLAGVPGHRLASTLAELAEAGLRAAAIGVVSRDGPKGSIVRLRVEDSWHGAGDGTGEPDGTVPRETIKTT